MINSVFVKMNSLSKRGEMNLLNYTQYQWDILGIGSTHSMELDFILHMGERLNLFGSYTGK